MSYLINSVNSNSKVTFRYKDGKLEFNLEKFVEDEKNLRNFEWYSFKGRKKAIEQNSTILNLGELVKILSLPHKRGSNYHTSHQNLASHVLNLVDLIIKRHHNTVVELQKTYQQLNKALEKINNLEEYIKSLKNDIQDLKNEKNVIRKDKITVENPDVRIPYVKSLRDGLSVHMRKVYSEIRKLQGIEEALEVYRRLVCKFPPAILSHFSLLHQKYSNNLFLNDEDDENEIENCDDDDIDMQTKILARIETLAKDLNEKHSLPQYSMGFLAKYEGVSQILLKFFSIFGAVTTKNSVNVRYSLARMKPSYNFGLISLYSLNSDKSECFDNFNCDELGNNCIDGFLESYDDFGSFSIRRKKITGPTFQLTWVSGVYRALFLSQTNSSGSTLQDLFDNHDLENMCAGSYPDVCRNQNTQAFFVNMEMSKEETKESRSQSSTYPLPLEAGNSSSIIDFTKILLSYHYVYEHFNRAKATRSYRILIGDGEFMNHMGFLIGTHRWLTGMNSMRKRRLKINKLKIDWCFLFSRLPWGGIWHIQKNAAIGITPMRYSKQENMEATHSMGMIKFLDDLMYRVRLEYSCDGDESWKNTGKLGREYDYVMRHLIAILKVWRECYPEFIEILRSVKMPNGWNGKVTHPDFFDNDTFPDCTYLPNCEEDILYCAMDFVLPTIVDFKDMISMNPRRHKEFLLPSPVGGVGDGAGTQSRGRVMLDEDEEEEEEEEDGEDNNNNMPEEEEEDYFQELDHGKYKRYMQKLLMNMYVVCHLNNHSQRVSIAWMMHLLNVLEGADLIRFLDLIRKLFEVKVEFIHGDREVTIKKRGLKGTFSEKQWINYAAPGAEKNREYRSEVFKVDRNVRYKDNLFVPEKLYNAVKRAFVWFAGEIKNRKIQTRKIGVYPFIIEDYIMIPYGKVISKTNFQYYCVKKEIRFPSVIATDENLRSDLDSFLKRNPSKEQEEKMINLVKGIDRFQRDQNTKKMANPDEDWTINSLTNPVVCNPKNKDYNRLKHLNNGLLPGVDLFNETERRILKRKCIAHLKGEFSLKKDAPQLLKDFRNELERMSLPDRASLHPLSLKNFVKNFRSVVRSAVKQQSFFTFDDVARICKEGHSDYYEKQAVSLVLGELNPDFVEPMSAFENDRSPGVLGNPKKRRRMKTRSQTRSVDVCMDEDEQDVEQARMRLNVKRRDPQTPMGSPTSGFSFNFSTTD